jgi:hypothetical protein
MAHANGSFYHHPVWLATLSKEYGQEGIFLACENESKQLQAIMPMFYTRGIPFGRGGVFGSPRLSSLPRTPLGGPLAIHSDAAAAILHTAKSLTSNDPGARLQIKTQNQELDGLVPGIEATPWRFSYVLKRVSEADESFRIPGRDDRAKVKRAINKAARLGVRIRLAETESDLRGWYRLYLDTMRRNAVPPRSLRFFLSLWDLSRASGMMELLLAQVDEGERTKMVAGSIFFKFGNTVSYAFGASRRKDLFLRANDAIMWHAINRAFSDGFVFFDLGEVPSGNAKLAQFKSKWGAERVALYHYYYPALSAVEFGSGGSINYQTLIGVVWKKLPLSVTAWLGDRIYSFL